MTTTYPTLKTGDGRTRGLYTYVNGHYKIELPEGILYEQRANEFKPIADFIRGIALDMEGIRRILALAEVRRNKTIEDKLLQLRPAAA